MFHVVYCVYPNKNYMIQILIYITTNIVDYSSTWNMLEDLINRTWGKLKPPLQKKTERKENPAFK